MRTTIAVTSCFAFFANAQLSYDHTSQGIKCPTASGIFCAGPASPLIVHCTNGVGAVSTCDSGATCYQTSPATGDAICSASAPLRPVYTGPIPWIAGGDWKDGKCNASSAPWPKPSTPAGPIIPPPHYSNSSTPAGPVIPSSTPCTTSSTTPIVVPSTPALPVIPSSTPCTSSTSAGPVQPPPHGTGTGTGYAYPTTKVTTLNSSWKPTPTQFQTAPSSSTIAGPVFATGAAASGKGVNAIMFGLAGLAVALV